MRQPAFRRWPAWHNRLAVFSSGGSCQPAGYPERPDGPLAPAALRATDAGPDGIRRGLVAYYRELIAAGGLDAGGRFAAAEAGLFDALGD